MNKFELPPEAIAHLDKLPLGNVLKDYVEIKKVPCGDFVNALILNDLFRAVKHADLTSLKLLPDYARFFIFYAPSECYGSYEKVEAWLGRTHDQWTLDIRNFLIERLEISNSDAQGVMQAEFFLLAQEWTKKSTASDTADRIINLPKSAT
jgi:hypothetical protein